MVTKTQFASLFKEVIEEAITEAEKAFGRSLPRDVEIQLHGSGHGGDLMGVDQTIDRLYLGPDLFYKVINVGVRQFSSTSTLIFVGVSSHQPGSWSETWNLPNGRGPLKVVIPMARDSVVSQLADFKGELT